MQDHRITDDSNLIIYFMYMNQAIPSYPANAYKHIQIKIANISTFLGIKNKKGNYITTYFIYTPIFKCTENGP